MTDIVERLHTIRAHLRTGALGQREVWEAWLTEAADQNERLRKDKIAWQDVAAQYTADNERLEEALRRIEEWSRAYPLKIFPKPDLKRARELLGADGMTLDAISADVMRHMSESVGKIAREALRRDQPSVAREPEPEHQHEEGDLKGDR